MAVECAKNALLEKVVDNKLDAGDYSFSLCFSLFNAVMRYLFHSKFSFILHYWRTPL